MQKVERWRSKKYLDFVKTLPCISCQYPEPSTPHHLKHIGNMSGGGLKAPDWASMPLCEKGYKYDEGCHKHLHNTPELWHMQWEWIAKTMAEAIKHCKGW